MRNPLLSKQANGWTIPIKEATRYNGFYPEAVGGGWNPSDGNDISSSLSKQMGGYMGGTRTSAPVQDYIDKTYRGSQEIWDKDKDSEHAKAQTVPMVQDKKNPAKGKNALLQSPERRGTNPELRHRIDTMKFTISDMQRHLNDPSLLLEEKKEVEDTILHYQEMLDTLIAQARGGVVDLTVKVGQRRSSLNKPASAVPNAIKVHGLATKWMNENKAGRIAQVAGKYAVRSDADTITRRMAKLANRSIK